MHESSRLAASTKLTYGIGAVSDSIKTFSFTTFLLFYYTTVLGLPGGLLGLAMSVGLVWDAAIDPFIGHLSDRVAPRFGRRHAFMLAGALCAGASFIAVFNPPSGLSTAGLFAWLMVSSLCLRSSNSVFMVPYSALGAELPTSYHERTSISAYRAGTVLIGTLLVTAAAFLVFLPNGNGTGGEAKFMPGSYRSMGVAFGLAMIASGLIATFGTLRERGRLASSIEAGGGQALGRAVLGTLRGRPFRIVVLASSLAVMAAAMNAALSLHFLTYHARIGAGQSMTLYYGAFYTGAMLGVLIWARVVRQAEKHHVYAATTMITAVVMSSGYWLIGEGRPFGTGNISALVALNGIAGFFGIAGSVIAPSMMADITAHDERQGARRRDGIFFGVYSFGQQIAGGLAVLVAGLLVDRFAGLVPAQSDQSSQTIERLVIVSNLLPAAMLAGAALVALGYPLTRRELQHTADATVPSARHSELQTYGSSEPA